MRRLAGVVGLAALTACASSITPAENDVTLVAEQGEYSTHAGGTHATVSVALRIINKSDLPARLGCSFNVERDRGSGFETVSHGACSVPSSAGTIPARSEELRVLSRAMEASVIEESARYRVATSIALGPDFTSGIGHKSTSFALVRRE